MKPSVAIFVFLSASLFHLEISALPSLWPTSQSGGSGAGVLLYTKPDPNNPDQSLISMLPVQQAPTKSDNAGSVKTRPISTTLPFPTPQIQDNQLPLPVQEPDNINVPVLQMNPNDNLRLFFNKTGFNLTSIFGSLG